MGNIFSRFTSKRNNDGKSKKVKKTQSLRVGESPRARPTGKNVSRSKTMPSNARQTTDETTATVTVESHEPMENVRTSIAPTDNYLKVDSENNIVISADVRQPVQEPIVAAEQHSSVKSEPSVFPDQSLPVQEAASVKIETNHENKQIISESPDQVTNLAMMESAPVFSSFGEKHTEEIHTIQFQSSDNDSPTDMTIPDEPKEHFMEKPTSTLELIDDSMEVIEKTETDEQSMERSSVVEPSDNVKDDEVCSDEVIHRSPDDLTEKLEDSEVSATMHHKEEQAIVESSPTEIDIESSEQKDGFDSNKSECSQPEMLSDEAMHSPPHNLPEKLEDSDYTTATRNEEQALADSSPVDIDIESSEQKEGFESNKSECSQPEMFSDEVMHSPPDNLPEKLEDSEYTTATHNEEQALAGSSPVDIDLESSEQKEGFDSTKSECSQPEMFSDEVMHSPPDNLPEKLEDSVSITRMHNEEEQALEESSLTEIDIQSSEQKELHDLTTSECSQPEICSDEGVHKPDDLDENFGDSTNTPINREIPISSTTEVARLDTEDVVLDVDSSEHNVVEEAQDTDDWINKLPEYEPVTAMDDEVHNGHETCQDLCVDESGTNHPEHDEENMFKNEDKEGHENEELKGADHESQSDIPEPASENDVCMNKDDELVSSQIEQPDEEDSMAHFESEEPSNNWCNDLPPTNGTNDAHQYTVDGETLLPNDACVDKHGTYETSPNADPEKVEINSDLLEPSSEHNAFTNGENSTFEVEQE